MNDERITTESVALNAQESDPIVLRDSGTRRLIFKPMIVDKPEAPVRGVFVWQRKRETDEWEDITGETLRSLKAGEGYSLELRSGEVSTLVQGIQARKEIYEKYGVQFGQQDYFAGTDLPEAVRKILEEPNSELARALRALDPESLLSLGRSSGSAWARCPPRLLGARCGRASMGGPWSITGSRLVGLGCVVLGAGLGRALAASGCPRGRSRRGRAPVLGGL